MKWYLHVDDSGRVLACMHQPADVPVPHTGRFVEVPGRVELYNVHPELTLMLVGEQAVWQDLRNAAQQAADARVKRDRLLAETDWRVVKALETGDALSSDYKAYRKALRNVSEQPGWPAVIDWPVLPR